MIESIQGMTIYLQRGKIVGIFWIHYFHILQEEENN